MFGYHVPARAISVFRTEGTLNDLIIIFENFETAVAFALYDDVKNTNEAKEYFPIYEFLVKDSSKGKIEKVRIDETGKVVEQGGKYDAWRTEYSNLLKIRATLSYIRKDIPDFVFNTKPTISDISIGKNESWLLNAIYTVYKLISRIKFKEEIVDTVLTQQVKALHKKLRCFDPIEDTPVSFQENPNIHYKKDLLGRKGKTLSELVPANDGKRKEVAQHTDSASYNKVKKK